uniref:Uncharacterized protein n=1 Tax=Avena sativa TaxID=4498 RepID=A0ACD5XUQ6_AVESA
MINTKSIAQLEKLQTIAVLGRKRLLTVTEDAEECSRRFEVPLAYLGTTILEELLEMSPEEFGFIRGSGRITLQCHIVGMEYVMFLL